jgi:hexosaminidase
MLLSAVPPTIATTQPVMPLPAEVLVTAGRLNVTRDFKVALSGAADPRLRENLTRLLRRAEERTGLTFARTPDAAYVPGNAAEAALVVECGAASAPIPALGEDESYHLVVESNRAVLRAPTTLGVLRGYETFLQLLQSDAQGWFLPALTIDDRPRFPWRGLMLDVCRHWQPMEVVKRNLDGMALVKLNVLHLHLTEDQGFRIESKTHPKLHELGSDGRYFTQDEMREIIAYAAARGIRVVPEFDIPGHATSWLVAYPELGSAPGPYHIERKWGIFDPVLDPTNEAVYRLLDDFLGEMAALFPDPYLHIGGDENNGVHWSANTRIQSFIKEHQLKDNAGLHAYFNKRVNEILVRHGKKLVGWDEILHPDLPAGSVVHSWRGPEGIAEATRHGYAAILSNGYYIDLMFPTTDHYLNDPVPPGSPLSPEQQQLVLGGEATMWAEWVTPETIDSRIWPRTAAIAERLWSPVTVRDVPDMYRRLALVSQRLEEAGLRHASYLEPALRRLAGDNATARDRSALRTLADLVEPVKRYRRGQHQPDATQFMPLTGLVDCARADSGPTREFAAAVDKFLADPKSEAAFQRVRSTLEGWRSVANDLLARTPPRLQEAKPLLQALSDAADVGVKMAEARHAGRTLSPDAIAHFSSIVKRAGEPHAAVELPAAAVIQRLISHTP